MEHTSEHPADCFWIDLQSLDFLIQSVEKGPVLLMGSLKSLFWEVFQSDL